MAKDRTLICKYYICHGSCIKGKDASVDGYCQRCQKYKPKKGTLPARPNRKQKKMSEIRRKEFQRGDLD